MSILRLILREISGRKLHFTLGVVSVTLAVAVITGVTTSLRIHDRTTAEVIARKERETVQRMALLEDDYRKIMKNLGFNLLILPQKQKLSALYEEGIPSAYMPEEFVARLAAYPSLFIRHMLPSLQQKQVWPETGKSVILAGIRGEVPVLHEIPREPIMVAVPRGTVHLGFELHNSLQLKKGSEIRVLGRRFRVGECNPARGDQDDITVWMDLREAQELLKKPGEINAILALKCHCVNNDLGQVRAEVEGILPGVQVIEKGSNVLTRAEARDRAAREAKESVASEKGHRERMRREQEQLASVLIPSVVTGGMVWVAFLFFGNVRDRRSEIGILRAVGCRRRWIMALFLGKALLVGWVGAAAGYLCGLIFSSSRAGRWPLDFFQWEWFLAVSLLASALALSAAYLPATFAANQDPAEILKEN
jgi:putative ABC transport system permease protein